MKITTALKFCTFLITVFAVSLVVSAAQQPVAAQDNTGSAGDAQKTEEQAAGQASAPETAVQFVYTAQPGDSYTLMARKALQTYGLKYGVELGLAGIIFAETNMTKEAGSPHLAVGQQVQVDESAVKAWADKALALTDAEQKAWGYYAQFANFNTDNVGETR